MKYILYTLKLIWKILTKLSIFVPIILFPFVFIKTSLLFICSPLIWLHIYVAYKFRKYANNIVFNYVIKNKKHLPRLFENEITEEKDYYKIKSVRNGKVLHGQIKKKEVSTLKFYVVLFFLWGWSDSDSTLDTTTEIYGRDILNGEHFKWFPQFILDKIAKEQEYLEKQVVGNAFELGDNIKPIWSPILSTLWLIRNTAYNFNYYFEEIAEDDKYNFYYHTKRKYPTFRIKEYKKIKYPSLELKYWHFGYIPYENSERKGRYIYFTEDYDKVDKAIIYKYLNTKEK